MSFSPSLGTTITNTRMRTPDRISPFSGMCSVCTADCIGSCEIGYSAIRGEEALYPSGADKSQFASEKDYPIDLSHFNINGRVFGAEGIEADTYKASFPNVDISTMVGIDNPIKLKAPFILPAIAKLNWPDYYAGAALAGIMVVIGEDAVVKDKELGMKNNRVTKSPLLKKMLDSFNRYNHGYGDIVLQANYDDEHINVLDYAISELGTTTVELKFGQAAKGIQGMGFVYNLEDALEFQKKGYLVIPDPSDPIVQEKHKKGIGPHFQRIGKLPMWDEETLTQRIGELRSLGVKRILFKMAAFDPKDMIRVLKIASNNRIDLVTFDAAGGGSGNSPCKMMNEWGLPIVYMESILYDILYEMNNKGYELPKVAVAGGFAMEDQIFKGLSLGAPYISMIAIGRAAMAAAMAGKKVGELIDQGQIPKELQKYGGSIEEIYRDIRLVRDIYGSEADSFSPGALGLFSYINRVSTGLRQLMALNRKFTLNKIDRTDIIALTKEAGEISGISTVMDYKDMIKELI
ncbi:MAG: FMN-binding glutamate synthase family protein [Clostridiales bacterium]|nr:FMN-binding glutamate synthase family protein [Clostridiales bacterium]